MKTLFVPLLCVAALMTACTPNAQLVTLRGNNVKPAPEGLVLDNDTLTLRYNFSSERGQMRIAVVNKLNQPLYIDWKRSSFIIGQDKLDYWYDVANVNLAGSSYSGRYSRYTVNSLNGTISREDPVTFIPPHTTISRQQFTVYPNGSLRLPGTPEIVKEASNANPGSKNKVKVSVSIFNYSAEQSPLQFRSYLTLSTDKDFKTDFHIDTQFWASDVRVLPREQLTGVLVQHEERGSDYGSYFTPVPFNKPDGFYIPLPVE